MHVPTKRNPGRTSSIRIDHVTILRTAEGESPDAWSRALAAPAWLGASQLLKQEGAAWVHRATIRGRDVVVKCRPLNSLSRRVKHTLHMGHAHKHWRGAELLHRAKVRTAKPFLIARARIEGRTCELLVLEHLPGPTLLECMQRAWTGEMAVRQQHAVARAVGVQLSSMGWNFNRDHKPSNLIVLDGHSSEPTIAVIDCVGVRFRQVCKIERMMASLVIEPLGCGVLPRRTLLMRGLRSMYDELQKWDDPADHCEDGDAERPMTPRQRSTYSLKQNWRGVVKLVYAHGDPRPTHNPLAPPVAPSPPPR